MSRPWPIVAAWGHCLTRVGAFAGDSQLPPASLHVALGGQGRAGSCWVSCVHRSMCWVCWSTHWACWEGALGMLEHK